MRATIDCGLGDDDRETRARSRITVRLFRRVALTD